MTADLQITVFEYKELIKFIECFKKNNFDLLVIVGGAGLGKTFNCKKVLNSSVYQINSHATPLGLYREAYVNKDKNLWFDDVDDMFNNDKLIGLMKQFAETEPVKNIMYLTSINLKGEIDIPLDYQTKSKILMTCNTFKRIKNKNILALLNRGIVINFEPTEQEVTKYIKENFKQIDEEAIQFICDLPEPNIRTYVKILQLKKAGFKNWKELLQVPSIKNNRH